MLTYIIVAVLAAMGAESCALRMSHIVAVACVLALTCGLPALVALFFALPNSMFSAYGYVAVVGGSLSRLVQVVLYVDFAYDLNDWLYGAAREIHLTLISGRAHRCSLGAMVVSSLLMIAGSIGAAVYLCIICPEIIWLVCSALLIGLICLVVSITDWCEHGSLFASSVVLTYIVWLCYDVHRALPSGGSEITKDLTPTGIGLLFALLIYYGLCYGLGRHSTGSSSGLDPDSDDSDFLLRCLVHAVASCYICTGLAPYQSYYKAAFSIAVVYISLLLYAWTLVAPKVLSSRAF